MRLPLLVAARPRTAKCGPIVPLPSGRWHVVADNLFDSILEIVVNDVPFPTQLVRKSDGHVVQGPADVQVVFVKRGSEAYINVGAELVSGRNVSH